MRHFGGRRSVEDCSWWQPVLSSLSLFPGGHRMIDFAKSQNNEWSRLIMDWNPWNCESKYIFPLLNFIFSGIFSQWRKTDQQIIFMRESLISWEGRRNPQDITSVQYYLPNSKQCFQLVVHQFICYILYLYYAMDPCNNSVISVLPHFVYG